MKKIIFLLAMTTFLFSDFAMQAQTKKELRAKRKAHRECMRMHNRMVREQQNMIAYQDAVKALKSNSWVLQANTLFNNFGAAINEQLELRGHGQQSSFIAIGIQRV